MRTDRPVVVWGFADEYARQTEGKAIASHAYIHAGYAKAFTALGFNTYWRDDAEASEVMPDNAIIFCMNCRADHLPYRPDLFYVGHNLEPKQTDRIDPSRRIGLQYLFKDCPGEPQGCDYVKWNATDRTLYMPWASDLLPSEIDYEVYMPHSNVVYWVGSVWNEAGMGNEVEIGELRGALAKHNIELKVVRALDKDHAEYIRQSRFAPAMQGRWQIDKGYIPCRAFKNASYGQMVVTNNPAVRDLFEGHCVYGDTIPAMVDAAAAACCAGRRAMTLAGMKIVRGRHCYMHRVESLMKIVDTLA